MLSQLPEFAEGWQRQALHDAGLRSAVLAHLDGRQPVSGEKLYPFGLDGSGLWKPYQAARNGVELYAVGDQEAGCQVAWLAWLADEQRLEIGIFTVLPSRCPRFASRACPKMAPMGHESGQTECNYWASPRFQELCPGLELYPEWQRFDCHKYYPLFQAHLVGEALALALQASVHFTVCTPGPQDAKLVQMYASFSSRPDAWSWQLRG